MGGVLSPVGASDVVGGGVVTGGLVFCSAPALEEQPAKVNTPIVAATITKVLIFTCYKPSIL
ncbi:hypothetical protein JP09_003810 [Dehalogenimonas etheniformans]|uniref:Uncharacterized protein n=1 Tax=Dehalogenimonas etheniformans TaxID=1536648 RepID=A0A2P5P9P4_9CHLR|nr:hypothetical protein JP09_003810 [Dehalogenimonas etheniformans]